MGCGVSDMCMYVYVRMFVQSACMGGVGLSGWHIPHIPTVQACVHANTKDRPGTSLYDGSLGASQQPHWTVLHPTTLALLDSIISIFPMKPHHLSVCIQSTPLHHQHMSACHHLAILCSNLTSQGQTLHATPPTAARTHLRNAETADSNPDYTNCLHVL